jgi:cobalamin biosynthesis Co2+ chelatase CbiK
MNIKRPESFNPIIISSAVNSLIKFHSFNPVRISSAEMYTAANSLVRAHSFNPVIISSAEMYNAVNSLIRSHSFNPVIISSAEVYTAVNSLQMLCQVTVTTLYALSCFLKLCNPNFDATNNKFCTILLLYQDNFK